MNGLRYGITVKRSGGEPEGSAWRVFQAAIPLLICQSKAERQGKPGTAPELFAGPSLLNAQGWAISRIVKTGRPEGAGKR
jgi:hypothetical protein